MSVQFNFKGKVTLITGGGSGIGAATALAFCKSGADVVIADFNAENMSNVAKQCREVSQSKSKVLEVVADVTKEEDLKRLVDETIKTFGKLDILVNNVGIALMGSITDSDYMQTYKKVMDLNLNSLVLLTHLSVKHLEKTKGNIINNSSVAALRSFKGVSHYNISKAGLDMFTRCMAAELGPKGIRVNSIFPSQIRTAMYSSICEDKVAESRMKNIVSSLPMGRLGEGEDIANAIMFLVSNEASFITGSGLVLDGGQLAANVPII